MRVVEVLIGLSHPLADLHTLHWLHSCPSSFCCDANPDIKSTACAAALISSDDEFWLSDRPNGYQHTGVQSIHIDLCWPMT